MRELLKALKLIPSGTVVEDTSPEPIEYDEYKVTITHSSNGWWQWRVTLPQGGSRDGITETRWGAKREVRKTIRRNQAETSYTVKVRKP